MKTVLSMTLVGITGFCYKTVPSIMKTVPGITTSPLQIPKMILSLGAEPKTRGQRATMIESAHETVLYPEDLQHID